MNCVSTWNAQPRERRAYLFMGSFQVRIGVRKVENWYLVGRVMRFT